MTWFDGSPFCPHCKWQKWGRKDEKQRSWRPKSDPTTFGCSRGSWIMLCFFIFHTSLVSFSGTVSQFPFSFSLPVTQVYNILLLDKVPMSYDWTSSPRVWQSCQHFQWQRLLPDSDRCHTLWINLNKQTKPGAATIWEGGRHKETSEKITLRRTPDIGPFW